MKLGTEDKLHRNALVSTSELRKKCHSVRRAQSGSRLFGASKFLVQRSVHYMGNQKGYPCIEEASLKRRQLQVFPVLVQKVIALCMWPVLKRCLAICQLRHGP